MIDSITRHFLLQVPEDDPESALTIKVFNAFCLSMIAFLAVIGFGTIFVFVRKAISSITVGVLIVMLVIAMSVARRGYMRMGSALLVFGLWTIGTIHIWLSGSINTVLAAFYIVVIVMAAVLLGRRFATIVAVLSSAVAFFMTLLTSMGYTLPHYYPMPPWSVWLVLVFTLVLMVPAIEGTLGALHEASSKIRKEIETRRDAEEALRESETRYRTLFETALDSIYILDAGDETPGRIVSANPAAAEMHGYTVEELLTMNIADLGTPECAARVSERIEKLKRGERLREEVTHKRKDGTVFPLEINSQLVELGGRKFIMAVDRDITDRKQAEEALRESEAMYRTLIQFSPDGMFVQIGDTIEFANAAMSHIMCAESPEALKGTRVLDLVHPDDQPLISQRIVRNLELGEPVPLLEQKLVRLDGEVFWAEAAGTPILFRGQDARMVFVRDISERKNMEKQILEDQKMKAVGTLAGGISHEFNNVLQIILGHTELLMADRSTPGHEELAAIMSSAERGAELVRKILTFSRRVDSKFESIDLNANVREAERLLSRTIPKMIDIRLDLAKDLKLVRADPAHIEQMILSLAINAKDAMPDGGRLVFHTANVAPDEDSPGLPHELPAGDFVLLEIADTGHGIEMDVVERIFEPFFTTKDRAEGSGLGLSTVFGIVKMHEGHVTCESELDKGTMFKIYLPVVAEAPERTEDQDVPFPRGGSEKILVVDDELLIQNLARRILERSGYSVICAGSGREGLHIYKERQEEISLILLDLIMPEMGGKQCLELILEMDPQAKVLISSGLSMDNETRDYLGSAAKGTVAKPFKIREMLQAVRSVLDETHVPDADG